MPALTQDDHERLFMIPNDPEEISLQIKIMRNYSNQYPFIMTLAWSYSYIALLSLAIPGGNICGFMAPSLFGFNLGFIYITIASTIGSIICYFLSLN